ncbi:hypothetical protein N9396_04275 [Candidatus Pelagibacter ubique]|nr:hypothetical protein [Candidatus Pelagibacter ubique]
MMFLKKIFSSKKNKITNDDILNLFKFVNSQVKLVDVVCQRDKKTYKTKNKQLISLMNSDWVCGYIIGLSIQYFSNMKLDMKENFDVFIHIISDVFHMLKINNSKKSTEHTQRIDNFIINKLYKNKKTDSSKGFYIGMYDYNNLLKITEDKVKVDKIIPLMELCHYLTDELDLGRIIETHD